VRHPKVFLFDEPLSNLDAGLRVQMRLEIERLHRELGTTMIYVTHDQVEAMTLADRIVAPDGGKVQQVGAPLDLYARPGNRFVAGFIGSPMMNFIPATVLAAGTGRTSVSLDIKGKPVFDVDLPGVRPERQVTIGLRPESIAVNPSEKAGLPATVETVERLANITFAYLNIGLPGFLTVQIMGEMHVTNGQGVQLSLTPSALHVFDKAGTALR